MDESVPTHTDPTHDAYQPHAHVSLLSPVHAIAKLEQAVEDGVVNVAFGLVARHLPAPKPKPPPSPAMALVRKLGMPVVKLVMGLNQYNGTTNGNLKTEMMVNPCEGLYGFGAYAATIAAAELTEFAAHQLHVHAHAGRALDLARPQDAHLAYASPDE